MRASRLRGRSRNLIFGIALVAALVALASWLVPGWFVSGSHAAPAGGGVVTVGKGAIGPHHWMVRAAGDQSRKGVCLETSVYLRRPQNGGPGDGRCAAPSAKRGSVTSVVERSRGGDPKLTVLGAAFDPAVARVEVKMWDGGTEKLALRRIRGAGSQIAHYRYVAVAKAGSWCVSALITRNGKGSALWRASGAEVLPYDPATVCGAPAAAP